MGRKYRILVWIVVAGGIFFACTKSDKQKAPTPMSLSYPLGWPEPVYDFSGNPLTKEGFELGRRLFYDGKLSRDGNFPCASCHQQFAAFATYDHDYSHGFDNQFTTRNAPGLFNLIWMTNFHWDGGINHIEVQPLAPITAENEMAETIENVIAKLKADPKYPGMFAKAFGDGEIDSRKMLLALAQFMGAMISSNSKYDKVMAGKDQFTYDQQQGYELFKAKCASCHAEPLFTDGSYRNNGLIKNPFTNDVGRMNITGRSEDSLKFKVPSLRNVFLTFPYMHDGRFRTVTDVLNHYSDGITDSPTLDPLLKNKIPLTPEDKFYLLEFLRTLTDTAFVSDKRFSEQREN